MIDDIRTIDEGGTMSVSIDEGEGEDETRNYETTCNNLKFNTYT